MPEDDAINLLRGMNANTYTRKDMTDNKRRAGFIAQDFEIAPSSLGDNFVGGAVTSPEEGDE